MASRIQNIAIKIGMSFDDFIGEMRKCGCSEATATKIWNGNYETFEAFSDNDIYLSNLRKAAYVLKVETCELLKN